MSADSPFLARRVVAVTRPSEATSTSAQPNPSANADAASSSLFSSSFTPSSTPDPAVAAPTVTDVNSFTSANATPGLQLSIQPDPSVTPKIIIDSSNASASCAIMSSAPSANVMSLPVDAGTSKQKTYTNESGYTIDIEKMKSLFEICGRGICLIDTSTGASGTGALYELLAGVYTLMTNHHVIRTTEVAEICRTKFKFEGLGELRLRPDDVELVVTSPEKELDVTIIQLRESCVYSLTQRNAHFFPVREPKQYDQVALVQYPKGKWSFDKGVIEEIDGVDVKYYMGGDCGASGSPILTWNFEAVGVHKRRENEAANVTLGCMRVGTAMPHVIDFFMRLLLAHFRSVKSEMADVKKQIEIGLIKDLEKSRVQQQQTNSKVEPEPTTTTFSHTSTSSASTSSSASAAASRAREIRPSPSPGSGAGPGPGAGTSLGADTSAGGTVSYSSSCTVGVPADARGAKYSGTINLLLPSPTSDQVKGEDGEGKDKRPLAIGQRDTRSTLPKGNGAVRIRHHSMNPRSLEVTPKAAVPVAAAKDASASAAADANKGSNGALEPSAASAAASSPGRRASPDRSGTAATASASGVGGRRSKFDYYRPERSTANWGSMPESSWEPPASFATSPHHSLSKTPSMTSFSSFSSSGSEFDFDPERQAALFARVDRHARELAARTQTSGGLGWKSASHLLYALFHARNITDELEKLRTIFSWVCAANLRNLRFDTKEELEQKLIHSTTPQLVEQLCAYAGLECALVEGSFRKGYEPADVQTHQWNAVRLRGHWELLDCILAKRYSHATDASSATTANAKAPRSQSPSVSASASAPAVEEFYFLPAPEQLYYTHRSAATAAAAGNALEAESESDWRCLPAVRPTFFRYGLRANGTPTPKGIIQCDAEAEFTLHMSAPVLLTFSITKRDNGESDEFRGVKLSRYGALITCEQEVTLRFRPPAPGTYAVLIFARHPDSRDGQTKIGPEGAGTKSYESVVEFRIVSRVKKNKAIGTFPISHIGPTEAAQDYGITQPVLSSNPIINFSGVTELVFALSRPLRIQSHLLSSSTRLTSALFDRCVIERTTADGRETRLTAHAPAAGEYALEVYANDAAHDGDKSFLVWQLLLVATSASTAVSSLPQLQRGFHLGALQPALSHAGLAPSLLNGDPYVRTSKSELTLRLAYSGTRFPRSTARLSDPANNDADLAHFVLQQVPSNEQSIALLMRFPHEGFFKLCVFALPADDKTESLPNVFNYLIEYVAQPGTISTASPLKYPQQYAKWREEQCFLYEPIDADLMRLHRRTSSSPFIGAKRLAASGGSGGAVRFRVRVPGANKVCLVVRGNSGPSSDKWMNLLRQSAETSLPSTHEGDSASIWFGDLNVVNYATSAKNLQVVASFETAGIDFSILLEYILTAD